MIYLSGSLPANPETRRRFFALPTGVLITPRCNYTIEPGWRFAADNGCFQKTWSADEWASWVPTVGSDALFAAVPDVVGDWRSTRKRWDEYVGVVVDAGLTPAFVLQDGQPLTSVPWSTAGALFIGGSTEFKLSPQAHAIVNEAKIRGKWVHMGRVNSFKRLRLAADWGCDSADGTFLAFGPDKNISRMEGWFRRM